MFIAEWASKQGTIVVTKCGLIYQLYCEYGLVRIEECKVRIRVLKVDHCKEVYQFPNTNIATRQVQSVLEVTKTNLCNGL